MPATLQVDELKKLLKHPQFYWWCGHVYFFINSVFYFTSALSFHTNEFYYRQAYLGALLSYGIVSFRAIGLPQRFQLDLFRDENIQYLALAFYWYSYIPMFVTLISFFVFSIFHILDYIQSVLIPTFFVPPSSNTAGTTTNQQQPTINKIKDQIKQFTEEKNDLALYIAAYSEVILITVRLMIGILLYQTSILAFIVFFHFLRLRYFVSPHTQHALSQTTVHLDRYLIPSVYNQFQPSVPKWVTKFYISLKDVITRYSDSIQSTMTPIPASSSTASSSTAPSTTTAVANDSHQHQQ
ncbi:unnamed protein product [Cunninghamella blakesleeana]